MVLMKGQYLGDLRSLVRHQPSGEVVQTDAPVDNEGRGDSFSPTDLLAAATVTCMMTTMGITAGTSRAPDSASRKRWPGVEFDGSGVSSSASPCHRDFPPKPNRSSRVLLEVARWSRASPRGSLSRLSSTGPEGPSLPEVDSGRAPI